MGTLIGTIDEDILNSIVEASKLGKPTKVLEESKEETKSETISQPKIKLEEGQVLFSSAFWTPNYIPDIPIKTWQRADWHENAQVMIPEVNKNWVWPVEATELFALAMYSDDTTLLYGYQGTGKSDLPAQWCAKFNIPMWRMSCHEQTREEHFVGSVAVKYIKDDDGNTRMVIQQEPSLLTDSLLYGGIFVEDEAFRHNSALVLQSLREKNTRKLTLPDAPGRTANERVLKAHKDKWRYVLTDNTQGVGDTTGLFQAQVQDASTLDRITATIEIDYLDVGQEEQLISSLYPALGKVMVRRMVKFANLIRSAFKTRDLQTTLSVRGIMAWAEKTMLFNHKPGPAIKLTFTNKLHDEGLAKVKDMYHQVFGEHL